MSRLYREGGFDLLNGAIPVAPSSSKNKKKKKKSKLNSQKGAQQSKALVKQAVAAPAAMAPPVNLSPIDEMIQVHGYPEEEVMMAWGQLKLQDPKSKVTASALLAKLQGKEYAPPSLEAEPDVHSDEEKHLPAKKAIEQPTKRAPAAAPAAAVPAAQQQTAVGETVSRFTLEQSLSSWDLTTQQGLSHLVAFAERLRATKGETNPQGFFAVFQSSNGLEILTQKIATGFFLADNSAVSQQQLERAIVNLFDVALGDGNNQFHRWLVQSLKSLSGVLRASENNQKYCRQIGKIINANRVAQRANSQLLAHINAFSPEHGQNQMSGGSLEELVGHYFDTALPDAKEPSHHHLEKTSYSGRKLDDTGLLISKESGAMGKLRLEDTYNAFYGLDQDVQKDIARIRANREQHTVDKTMIKAEKARLDKVAKNEASQRDSTRFSLTSRQGELEERKRALQLELKSVEQELLRVGSELARIDAPVGPDASMEAVDRRLDELNRVVHSFDKDEACGNSIRSLTVEAFERLKSILHRNTERLKTASVALGTSYYRELELHLEHLIDLYKFLGSRTAWCKEQLQSQPAMRLGLDDNLNKHLAALKTRCTELIAHDVNLLARVEKRVSNVFGVFGRLVNSKPSSVASPFGERSLTDMINRLGSKGAPEYMINALVTARSAVQKMKEQAPAAAAAPPLDILGLGLTINGTNGTAGHGHSAGSSQVVGGQSSKPQVTAAPTVDSKAVAKPNKKLRNGKISNSKPADGHQQPAVAAVVTTGSKAAAKAPAAAAAPVRVVAAAPVRVAAIAVRAWGGWGSKAAAKPAKPADGAFPGLPAAAAKPASEAVTPTAAVGGSDGPAKKKQGSRRSRRKTGNAGAGAQQ